jgi:hypothetical protein
MRRLRGPSAVARPHLDRLLLQLGVCLAQLRLAGRGDGRGGGGLGSAAQAPAGSLLLLLALLAALPAARRRRTCPRQDLVEKAHTLGVLLCADCQHVLHG